MTKQEYKDIKSAWASAVNNKENKPYKDERYGTKHSGRINALHFMVYNIIRGFPKERGFEPLGRGYEEACRELDLYLKFDREEKLLFPFDGLVTLDTFKELVK